MWYFAIVQDLGLQTASHEMKYQYKEQWRNGTIHAGFKTNGQMNCKIRTSLIIHGYNIWVNLIKIQESVSLKKLTAKIDLKSWTIQYTYDRS